MSESDRKHFTRRWASCMARAAAYRELVRRTPDRRWLVSHAIDCINDARGYRNILEAA
jgi:hypothetical protein